MAAGHLLSPREDISAHPADPEEENGHGLPCRLMGPQETQLKNNENHQNDTNINIQKHQNNKNNNTNIDIANINTQKQQKQSNNNDDDASIRLMVKVDGVMTTHRRQKHPKQQNNKNNKNNKNNANIRLMVKVDGVMTTHRRQKTPKNNNPTRQWRKFKAKEREIGGDWIRFMVFSKLVLTRPRIYVGGDEY
ncbi:hypothetical protein N7455_010841 [Penicillium solitum]|uniref:uncharacterized protein n=1 Tax=Penicillium solitum TaxID=60172 RepID=UPI0032C432C3|nr:hypothetical protein N7455_010841 [Penicillium solitum]